MHSKGFIKSLKHKEQKALDYLIENYTDLIFKVSYGILNNRQLSEENTNDVILKIWNNASNFDREAEKFSVWVIVVTKYTAIDCLRREKKHSLNDDIENIDVKSSEGIEERIIASECVKEVKKEIQNMNSLDKEIFMRKFFMEHTSKEIGESLGITEKLVNLKIFRGRKKLKEKFSIKGMF
ncbi:MAG: sigma-70 family RNA polymerase sigma factor [Sarcina sp.]